MMTEDNKFLAEVAGLAVSAHNCGLASCPFVGSLKRTDLKTESEIVVHLNAADAGQLAALLVGLVRAHRRGGKA